MPRQDRLQRTGGVWWRRPKKRAEKKPIALPPMRPVPARGALPWRRPVEPMAAAPVTPAARAPFRRRPVEPMVPTPAFDLPTPSPVGPPMGVRPPMRMEPRAPSGAMPPVIQRPPYPSEVPPPREPGPSLLGRAGRAFVGPAKAPPSLVSVQKAMAPPTMIPTIETEEPDRKNPAFAQVMDERYSRAMETAGEQKGLWKALPPLGEWGDLLAVPIEMGLGWFADRVIPEEGKEQVRDPMAAEMERAATELAIRQGWEPTHPGEVPPTVEAARLGEEKPSGVITIPNLAAGAKAKYGDTPEMQRALMWSYSITYSGPERQAEAIDRIMAGEDPYVVCEWGHTTLENGKAIAEGIGDENPEIRAGSLAMVEGYIAGDEHAQAHYMYRTTVLGEDHETACETIAENGGVETSQDVWEEAAGRILFDPLTYTGLGILDFYRKAKVDSFIEPGAVESAAGLVKGDTSLWVPWKRTAEFQSSEVQRVAHDFIQWAFKAADDRAVYLETGKEATESLGRLLSRVGAGSDEALDTLRRISPVIADAATSRMGKMATFTLNLVSESPGAPKILKGGDGVAEFLARGSKSIDDFIGVKPRPKVLAWMGQVKGAISRYLHMGYNPAYAVRNLIGDTSQAVFDRSYRVVSGPEMSRFYDDVLGYTPRAATEGMGGAASEYATKAGLAGDLSKTGDRLRRHLMNKGVDEGTARRLVDAVSTLGAEDLFKVTDEGLVNLYGEAALEAMAILKGTLKKKWTSVLADGPAIALAGRFERFTGERIVYGGAKRHLDQAAGRWFSKHAGDLAEMPDGFVRLLRDGNVEEAKLFLKTAPDAIQATGYSLLHDLAEDSAAWKLAAGQTGTMARDFTLHNYDARYGFDTMLGVVFQYPFWTSRTAAKWIVRAIDNPGMMGNALSLIKAVHSHNAGLVDYEKGFIHFHDVLGHHVSVPLLSLVVPYYAMYETYNDPRMEELPFGRFYEAVNSVASMNQLMAWGLGLHYLASDDEQAQVTGRKMLAPGRQAKWIGGIIKGAAAAGVDVAQEVYAWGPSENRRIREQLAQQMSSGEITYEEAMIAVRDQDDLWDDAVERAAGAALLPALAGLLVATPRVQDPAWQKEVTGLYTMVGDLCDRREAGTITLEEWNAGWDLIGERYPWHGVLFGKPLDSQEKYAEIQRSLYYHEKDRRDEEYRMERDAILREKPHAKQELAGLREQYEVDLDALEKKYGQYREEVEGVEPPRDEYFPEERLQQQVLRSTGDALPHISDYTDAEGNPDYDALGVARADFWANVGDRVDVAAIAEAYGVEEDVVREALPDEAALTSYWRRNDSIPQAVNRIWRDEILGPAWEAYHAAVDAGADKSDAYEEHIESAEGMEAVDLLGKIQAAYPDRWTDGELRGELERIADIPSIEQATLERKEPEARALSEAKSAFWDFYNVQLPPGKMTRDIYDYPMVAAIMDAETRGTITTEQYAQALEYMEAWKVKNADPDAWGPPADWAKAREQNEEFEDARDEHFNWEDIKRIQSQYFDLSKSERKAWLVKYPELKEYWDFRTWFGDQKGNELWRYYYLGKTTSAGAKKRYYRKSGRRYYGRGRRGGGERFYGTTRVPKFYLKAPDPWETAMRGKRFYAQAQPELFQQSYRTRPTPWLKSRVQRLPWG